MIKMAINWIKITFSLLALAMFTVGGLIAQCEHFMPDWLRQSFRYGKFAAKVQQPIVSKVEVPKRWFRHMYLFAAPFSMCTLYLAICRYFYHWNVPENVYSTLDFLLGNDRQPLVSPASTILALTLVTIQSTKRLYETQFVSIFSDAKINITHYIAGFIHYAGLNLAILGESEGFFRDSEVNFQDSLSLLDWLVALKFLWMSYHQLQANFILANLRKNEKGVVVTKEHKIPTGGYFEYISNPLQFTEIFMYGMLQIILRNSSTYSYIYIWVVINQFVTGLLSHQWYQKTFKDYPPSRKIIVPYLL